ncbi:MAG: LamG-like jellyroll fold domain-containing protein, partial [Mycobacteriales bacterium]
MTRRGALALVAAVAALASACSSSSGGTARVSSRASGRPSASPSAAPLTPTAYERSVLGDRPRALYPLRDVLDGFRYGDQADDLVTGGRPAVDVDGAIDRTTGPTLLGQPSAAAAFAAQGRLVTPLTSGLTSDRAFTIELWFRADGCSNSWGRAAGTETAGIGGREGVSLFFYPKKADQACRLGVEVWHHDRYQLGCPKGMAAPAGSWVHLAATYEAGTLSCYLDGVLTERQRRPQATFLQTAPFDIGSAGAGIAG